jgi:hypothetical protein
MKPNKLLLLPVYLFILTVFAFSDDVTSVQRPNGGVNPFYVSNREPLLPSPFIKLPVGAATANGWVAKMLELQRDGLAGHLGEISKWLDKRDNAWLKAGGSYGWEEVPYWLKGYANLGYLLNDTTIIAESKIWIDAIFASQRDEGFFGPGNPDVEKGMDLWPNMLALFIMQSYYEHSGDAKVIDFMTRYFKWVQTYPEQKFLKTYWEKSRGGDMLYSCFWLYNQTGDKFLLDVAEKIHRNTANWMQQSTLPNWHNVNIAQCFREPATWWMYSKQDWHLDATYNDFWLIHACYGQVPGGMWGGDENSRPGYIDPRQGVETCGLVEQMSSDAMLVRVTGDASWADHCEEVLFNMLPAAFMPDFRALRYITAPNQVVSDSKNHNPGIDNRGPFLMMNPFSSRCCQHNHTHGLPYYVENIWMATPDKGIAAIMFNASTVKAKVGGGAEVTIKEETNYPFEEQIKFTVTTTNGKHTFPFYVRIPAWCSDAKILVNGKAVMTVCKPREYVRIDREWNSNDTVQLELPMKLNYRTFQQNKNCACIDYGPLTFSLKIKEQYTQMNSRETALHDSGWQQGADESKWQSYEIQPASDWNYGIDSKEFERLTELQVTRIEIPKEDFYPWTVANVPISLKVKARKIPTWKLDQFGLCAPVPQSPVKPQTPVDEVELIPMGAARLRISAFPVTVE